MLQLLETTLSTRSTHSYSNRSSRKRRKGRRADSRMSVMAKKKHKRILLKAEVKISKRMLKLMMDSQPYPRKNKGSRRKTRRISSRSGGLRAATSSWGCSRLRATRSWGCSRRSRMMIKRSRKTRRSRNLKRRVCLTRLGGRRATKRRGRRGPRRLEIDEG